VWTLDEVLNASSILGPEVEIKQRHRQVGGIPRHIFADDLYFEQVLFNQRNLLKNLAVDQVKPIAKGDMDAVGTFTDKQPKSALIGYGIYKSDDRTSKMEEVIVISSAVADMLYTRFIKKVWLVKNAGAGVKWLANFRGLHA
jgi:hypothetical protein